MGRLPERMMNNFTARKMMGEQTITTIRSRMNQNGTSIGAEMALVPPFTNEMSQNDFNPSRKVIWSMGTPMMGTRLVKSPTMMARRSSSRFHRK